MRIHWLLIVLVVVILAWIAVRRLLAWIRFSWRMMCFLLLIAAIVGAGLYVHHQSSTPNELRDPSYQSLRDDLELR